jgi:hypothetical protein
MFLIYVDIEICFDTVNLIIYYLDIYLDIKFTWILKFA